MKKFELAILGGGRSHVTRLEELSALGQSVWIDFLSRDLIESGGLERAIEEDAVVGVTSNPSIFGKALSRGSAYDAQIESSVGELISVFHALAMRDVAAACDVLRPVWERTGARDGYVSIEVDPNLAADTYGSDSSGNALPRDNRPSEPAGEDPGDRRGCSCDRGDDRPRIFDQRHVDLLARPPPASGRGLPPRT